ncbi:FKBP-type peptidyl-prolyl cis-trans isomerase [Pedobacter sp. N36a]|uniref:FKBP-type peptidyl-prolyl cis-trans isomerase n=1 Tax=Pedobacter sp. N36a TaxID=2767996 RepID=UPI00165706EC|nr:FKBP-type peptidyl-prolyl cis-trans isomerase [Pedobacter sp. N36a]MBC8986019.1 FKBP-type peptidyl-prolyl cis-trans isomerase [Pedobacter sp. N36a]
MIKKLSLYTIALLATIVIFSSCKKEYESVQTIDDTKLADYFAKNNINAIADSAKTGYFYVPTPPAGSTDANNYKLTDSVRYRITVAAFSNGAVFATTPTYRNEGQRVGSPFGFFSKSVPAISQVLKKLNPGASVKIYLPSYLAFGRNGLPSVGIASNEIIVVSITTYKEKQAVLDDALIQAYLKANSITNAVKDASSGIYLQTTTVGTGTEVINLNSLVNFSYVLKSLDGGLNQDASMTNMPKKLIPAFRIMLPKFTKGSKVRMFIPSGLAYGNALVSDSNGGESIPPNSNLDYSVEVLEVTN